VKAKIVSLEKAIEVTHSLPTKYAGELHQIDTYFIVKKGRLKLREINQTQAELIFYDRDERSSQRISNYEVYAVVNALQIKQVLEKALGVLAVVKKKRRVFLYNETRIHLDEVLHLGYFLEFEVPIDTSIDSAKNVTNYLIERFNISQIDFISESYLDLVLRTNQNI